MAEKLSAKEAAIQLGTNARTLRKFLRSKQSPIEPVGQGNRYEFEPRDMKKLKKSFISWSNGSAPKKSEDKSPDADLAALFAEDKEHDDEGEYVGPGEYAGDVEEGDDNVDEDEIAFLEGPSEDDLLDIELELEEEEIE